jgi:hypothetical protein
LSRFRTKVPCVTEQRQTATDQPAPRGPTVTLLGRLSFVVRSWLDALLNRVEDDHPDPARRPPVR